MVKINRNSNYQQNSTKNEKMMSSLKYFLNYMDEIQKHYWLAGGTLLGWYRDCGIIPFTTDLDIGIWAHEYDKKIKIKFIKDKKLPLVLNFGFINDSYELRLLNQDAQIDIFLVYKYNQTHQWTALHEGRKKSK
jgi:hypothetical protein